MSYCIFCGETLNEKKECPNKHTFKKMCVNCEFSIEGEDGNFTCGNEEIKKTMLDKAIKAAKDAVGEGFNIESLNINALPLKKPVCKCGKWVLDKKIENDLKNLFV